MGPVTILTAIAVYAVLFALLLVVPLEESNLIELGGPHQ